MCERMRRSQKDAGCNGLGYGTSVGRGPTEVKQWECKVKEWARSERPGSFLNLCEKERWVTEDSERE